MPNFKQHFQQYWNIRWLRRSLISAFIIAIILVLIPIVLQYSIPYLLQKQGASKAQIEDINLNLFAGTFELKKLQITTAANKPTQLSRLYTDINMLDLMSGRIVIHEITIEDLDVVVMRHDDGTIAINGLEIPAGNETTTDIKDENQVDSKPVDFGLETLTIANSFITYRESGFEQKNQLISVHLSNLKSWDTTATADLKLDSLLNDAPFKLTAQLNPFKQVKQFKGHASLIELSVIPYEKFYRDHLSELQGSISLESDFDVSMAEEITATVKNQLNISKLKVAYQDISQSTQSINLESDLEISLADKVSVKVNNRINITDLMVDYKDVSQSVRKISWNGHTAYNNKEELTLKGDLQINNSQTTDKKQNYTISSFDQLNLKNLQKTMASINFDELKIKNIKLIDKSKGNHFVKFDGINIQKTSFVTDTPQLNIKQVVLDNPHIMVELNQQKQVSQLLPLFNTLDSLQADTTAEKATEESGQKKPSEPMKLEIAQLRLLNPGIVNFSDLSVSPNYKTQVQLNQLDFENISSINAAQFTIALKQQKYTTFDIKGSGLLFDPTKNMQLTAKIKQLDLPPITPYSSNTIGYGMKSGVIDTDIKMELKNREIDSEVDLKIDSIEVVETDKDTAEQVSSASGMSIDLAISSLKDSLNLIDLKLPVKGNIDKPDFDLSLIINKAMGKAMKSATLSYLKHTLQPFGSLVTLFSLAKKAANYISLPPLLFETNSLVFKKDQQELLDKVNKVLTERPGLKIKACGVSALEDQQAIKKILLAEEVARLEAINKTAQQKADKESAKKSEVKPVDIEEIVLDEQVIQQKMKELADNRADKVKTFFLEQAKLESSRILNCLSASKLEEKSVASVELQI